MYQEDMFLMSAFWEINVRVIRIEQCFGSISRIIVSLSPMVRCVLLEYIHVYTKVSLSYL